MHNFDPGMNNHADEDFCRRGWICTVRGDVAEPVQVELGRIGPGPAQTRFWTVLDFSLLLSLTMYSHWARLYQVGWDDH